MKKILSILFLISFFLFVSPVQAANTATLTQTCGTGTDGKSKPVLNAEWNLDEGVSSDNQCNIYIRTNTGNIQISTKCSLGRYSSAPGSIEGIPGVRTSVPLTDGGDYSLTASTGTERPGGGYIEVTVPLSSAPQYCERSQPGGNTGGGISNVESVFGKITPPQFIQNIGSGEKGISKIITTILNIIYTVSAIVFVFMVVWSAWQWITSGGEKDKVAAARQRLTYAIIGIVILAVSALVITIIGQIVGFRFFSS